MDELKEIPIIDSQDKDFKDKFGFEIWSTHSCSDYRNDRERPYNGQLHTVHGKRGKTEIRGITFRDLHDCFIKAILLSCSNEEIYSKAENNEWREQDVYLAFEKDPDIDPIAISQNLGIEIEKLMGIYPNVPELSEDSIDKFLGG